jgi:hypothetical protein
MVSGCAASLCAFAPLSQSSMLNTFYLHHASFLEQLRP